MTQTHHLSQTLAAPSVRVGVEEGVLVASEEALGVVGSLARRQEEVDHQPEGVLDQLGNDPAQQTAAHLQRRIRIHLTQPRLPSTVHQEVQTENLERQTLTCANTACGTHSEAHVTRQSFDGWEYVRIEVKGGVGAGVAVEFGEGEFVGGLEAVVVGEVLLDGVVGEVDAAAGALGGELLGGRAHVPLLEPVEPQLPARLHPQHEATHVQLTLLVQQRRNVLLQHQRTLLAHGRTPQHPLHRLTSAPEHADAPSTVAELPRLQNPHALIAANVVEYGLPVEAGEEVGAREAGVGILALGAVVVGHVAVEQLLVGDLEVVGQVVQQLRLLREQPPRCPALQTAQQLPHAHRTLPLRPQQLLNPRQLLQRPLE